MTEPGQRGTEVSATGPQHVAVVIAARNQRSALAATVRACRAIPGVDLIVVVDDGSDDDTGSVARLAGGPRFRPADNRPFLSGRHLHAKACFGP